MQRSVQLPTSPQPGWSLQEVPIDGTQLKSVAESMVVLQSLRQSRSKWVTSMFPKFSTKTRGKSTEALPPPHSIKAHGKYDLHIGPHIFSSTAIYEVHYLPSVDEYSGPEAQSTQPSSPPYSVVSNYPQASPPTASSSSSSYVTPALSIRVQTAAQTDPILANLLHAVINHTATDEQVKRLGFLIRELEGMDIPELEPLNIPVPATSAAPTPVRPVSPKPFDIILEFHEKPSDKWILPRGDVFCERVGVAEGAWVRYADVIITTTMTPSSPPSDPSGEQSADAPAPEVVSFRFSRVSQSLWEVLLTWAGGPQKMQESKAKLADMVRASAAPSYLQHRLPKGELLTELQNAVAPPYTTKSIKPAGADSNRARRKTVSRKPTLIISDGPSTPTDKSAPVKRRQSLKAKASVPPTPIACHACGQTDVPLMMGGRYCRTCIDAGKAVAEVRQVPAARSGTTTPLSYSYTVPMSTPQQAFAFTVPRNQNSAHSAEISPQPPNPSLSASSTTQQPTPPPNPSASG